MRFVEKCIVFFSFKQLNNYFEGKSGRVSTGIVIYLIKFSRSFLHII